MKKLIELYTQCFGMAPTKAVSLPKAGSNRHYVRLFDEKGQSVIGVDGPDVEENHCFVYLASHFSKRNLPVPKIFAMNDSETCYLQQDLGVTSLYEKLAPARKNNFSYGKAERTMLSKTIRALAHVQVEGSEELDYARCLEPRKFDSRAVMFDLNYFKYCFLKPIEVPVNEILLQDDFERLARRLGGQEQNVGFMYRDFQARNVMWKETAVEGSESDGGTPFFIDFQGGMSGPMAYDVASFLWQASSSFSSELREEMIADYLDEVQKLSPEHLARVHFDAAIFRQQLRTVVAFRLLQVLGAYGLRGFFERKKYFLDSIPPALQNLLQIAETGELNDCPTLLDLIRRLAAMPRFAPKKTQGVENKSSDKKLVVKVFSFSYKKGIPADDSGNGGGYVFDCRGLHNPGRYEQYKKLTGRDQEVIRFLEEDGEITVFLNEIYKLADAHVENYLLRGFSSLQFCFGCTGGQHRSVYGAEHLAHHLHEKFGVEVRLCHREQGVEEVLRRKE